jgi:hypothetical protein
MLHKKESDNATRASIRKEMAKPRMAKSVRTARVPGQARTIPPGTVDKIIASLRTTQPEKAQIAGVGADDRRRDRRIENTLTDGKGNGACRVESSVTAKAKK